LQQAMNQGNLQLIQDLTDQLAELDVTIQENTKAYFDARIADVNRVAGQGNTVIDYQKQILELQGAISGVTDLAGELALEKQRTGVLDAQRESLMSLLQEAQAAGNDQGVIDLTNQLYENQIALLQNTQAINELNGTATKPQQFSSTAWQWFRNAIFNGANGLLPQYSLSNMSTLPMSSSITPAANANGTTIDNSKTVNLEINQAGEVVDPMVVGNTVAFAVSTPST